MKLKDISKENRPIERLINSGEKSLSNYELLAIILKNGTKDINILDLSNYILSKYSFDKLENITINNLEKIKGIGKVKACQIKAIIELNKRINLTKNKPLNKIYSIKKAYSIIKPEIENKSQEHLLVLFLKNNSLISKKIITIGTNNQTLISNKDVLYNAISLEADSLIISHNHPSGENYPSKEDKIATNVLKKACVTLEINLLDHIIITKGDYFSFKEKGLI